ncbi:MAG: hypothetical protein A3D31_09230 [Candidatus Fluviicola riflensis]|nr:MAG: hypothetical protein CHH17_13640 [Candidatus Fluviicola riflensis]OGS77189.1 MAG: hypothetical protein A3D31_09230 [Candidatus Fluviicola riflensis]OGS82124.1 MAG: hypothetical protein A2724_18175 [Fluviicola sp. RIFCSPHIGHO2_01_FULL_43_53]OGS87818.1 MAG: hypothetical protein A3E30_15610 [Fluviicola sp. RIFCSPHIGHO2_12_FULL_43_24]
MISMKALLFLFLLVWGNSVIVRAQVVNIENKRIYDDTAGWSGSLDAGFSAIQNNKLLYSANFRPKVQYKTRRHYYLLLSDLVYTGGKNEVYANSGMSHFRYAYRLFNSPWKWESYAQVQYNQLLNQKVRSLVGTGIRWKFLDTNNVRCFAGTSTFYEYEELQTDHVINQGLRWSNYLSWFIESKNGLSFTAVTYAQPLWADLNDIRIAGQYTLGFHVLKRLDIRMEYNFFYDSRPPVGVRKMVFSSAAGFRVRLG